MKYHSVPKAQTTDHMYILVHFGNLANTNTESVKKKIKNQNTESATLAGNNKKGSSHKHFLDNRGKYIPLCLEV